MTEHDGTTCACHCHDGPPGYYACSEVGGCGTTWRAQHDPPALEPEPDPLAAATIDGEQACVYGCLDLDEHKPGCPCQATCPEHEGHCTGCAPRPAHGDSLMCGKCFYRRLRGPLKRVPALWDWLSSRKSGLKATAYDDVLVSSSKDPPLPFNPAIDDHLTLMSKLLQAWANRAAAEAPPGPGPASADAVGAAAWLDEHAGWISEQEWVLALVAHLKTLESRARGLAPWQPIRHALPVPCFRCEQQTLVLFGGEEWVTCTNRECDAVYPLSRYKALSRALGRIYEKQQQDVG